jgi:hypothetical protein
MNHILEIYSKFYNRIEDGEKTFEVRKNDRDFQVGDTLTLICQQEGKPGEPQTDITPSMIVEITYIMHGGDEFGAITPGFCVLGIKPYKDRKSF